MTGAGYLLNAISAAYVGSLYCCIYSFGNWWWSTRAPVCFNFNTSFTLRIYLTATALKPTEHHNLMAQQSFPFRHHHGLVF